MSEPMRMSQQMVPAVVLLSLLLALSPLSAMDKKDVNVVGGVGFAFDYIKGVLVELGVELELARGFFFQALANTYLDDQGGGVYYGGGGGWYSNHSAGLRTRPYGLSLYGLFKLPVSPKIKFFGKLGLHGAFNLRGGFYDSYGFYYYDDPQSGPDRTGLGAGAGFGFEHSLTGKLSVGAGLTYKMLFDRAEPDGWFKMTLAFNYRIK